MQIALIVVVLAALAVARSGNPLPVSGVGWRLMVVALGVAAVSLFALASSILIARGLKADSPRHRRLLARFRNLRRLHMALWLAASGGIIYWLGWGQLVRFNWGLDGAFPLDDLLILTPVLLPLVFSWAAFYEVERAVWVFVDKRASKPLPGCKRWQYVALHVRHHLGILLIPVLALLAVQDGIEIFAPGLLENGHDAVLLGSLLAVLLVLFPLMLKYVWRTHPLPPGPLRSRLEQSAGRSGVRARDILVWETDGMVLNAAVSGVFRGLRYIFLTDALLRYLGDEEIEAVFGHEAGHVKHRHLTLRMMAMVAPLSLWLLAEQMFPGLSGLSGQWSSEFGFSGLEFSGFDGGVAEHARDGLCLLAAMTIYVTVVFGPYSRLLEHQADLFSLRSLPIDGGTHPLKTIGSALEKLAANGAANRNTRSWQHASIARRVDFLNRIDTEPKRELHFQRRMIVANCFVVGVVFSPILGRLLSVSG